MIYRHKNLLLQQSIDIEIDIIDISRRRSKTNPSGFRVKTTHLDRGIALCRILQNLNDIPVTERIRFHRFRYKKDCIIFWKHAVPLFYSLIICHHLHFRGGFIIIIMKLIVLGITDQTKRECYAKAHCHDNECSDHGNNPTPGLRIYRRLFLIFCIKICQEVTGTSLVKKTGHSKKRHLCLLLKLRTWSYTGIDHFHRRIDPTIRYSTLVQWQILPGSTGDQNPLYRGCDLLRPHKLFHLIQRPG